MPRHFIVNRIVATLVALVILASGYTHARNAQDPQAQIVGEPDGLSGERCHTTMAYLDDAMITAQQAGEDTTIILIARLGKGENTRKLIRERLRQLRDHMTENRRFSSGKIVTAESERVNGLGQVDVYVGGKLHVIFKVKRNKDFAKGCVRIG